MPEQPNSPSPSERFAPAEHSNNFFELGLKTLKDRPEALKDLANDPEFVRSLDSMKSNQEVRAALDKAWNESLVSLYRAGFETASAQKQAEMIRALPVAERTLLVAHVRDYDPDNGADLPPTDPNDSASLESVAASMRRSMETAKNAETLKKSDIRGRFDALKTGASSETAKLLEGADVSTMRASDVARLRAEGIDLSKIFLVDAAWNGCEWKGAILEVSKNADPGKTSGMRLIVDFGGNPAINSAVGAGDILPDEVDRVKINGTEGVKKLDPRPGFYDAKTDRYLPIFDGYSIEILSSEELTDEDRKRAADAHMRRFEESLSEGLSDQIAIARNAPHSMVKAFSPKEAEALANVLSAMFQTSGDPAEVEKLKTRLLSGGVDLGTEGPYAEFVKKVSFDSLATVPGVPMGGIVSGPAERSPSGCTLCSKTARENAERIFGVRLPRGDAIDVQNAYGATGVRKSPDPARVPTEVSSGLPPSDPNANFADVFTGSKSEYGHRAVAFKRDGGWYVLDPYVTKTTDPVPVSGYPRPIRKAALYTLPSAA